MYIEQEIENLKSKYNEIEDRIAKIENVEIARREQNLLSTKEAAKYLNISRAALLSQIRKGKINAQKTCLGSRFSRYKISEKEIQRILEKI